MIKKFLQMMLFGLFALASMSSVSALDGEQAEDLYRKGQDALNSGRYPVALDSFSKLVDESPDQSDRALYWQAYTFNKVGRKKEALHALRRVVSEYPQSPWRDDAEALQIEVEGVSGGDQLENVDEDLKLYALDALHQVKPEKAVDLLEKFLNGEHSLKLKKHALFILAQTNSKRAAKILVEIARGSQGGELQEQAIQALGMVDEPSARKTLVELYQNTSDRAIKQAVMQSMVIASSKSELVELLRNEKDPELLASGLQTLGAMGAGKELLEFSRTLPPEHLPAALQGLGIANEGKAILDIMKSTKDETVVLAAIEALAIVAGGEGDERIVAELDGLYSSTRSSRVKAQILQALMIQNDGETLLRIFRREQDGELKRQALQALAMIDSPETEKLLEDLLKG